MNQALMEVGSLICTPRNPHCEACPLRALCPTRRHGLQEQIPAPRRQPKMEDSHEAAVVVESRGKILLRKCGDGERWAGLWDFPRFSLAKTGGTVVSRTASDLGRAPADGDFHSKAAAFCQAASRRYAISDHVGWFCRAEWKRDRVRIAQAQKRALGEAGRFGRLSAEYDGAEVGPFVVCTNPALFDAATCGRAGHRPRRRYRGWPSAFRRPGWHRRRPLLSVRRRSGCECRFRLPAHKCRALASRIRKVWSRSVLNVCKLRLLMPISVAPASRTRGRFSGS